MFNAETGTQEVFNDQLLLSSSLLLCTPQIFMTAYTMPDTGDREGNKAGHGVPRRADIRGEEEVAYTG